MRRHAKTFVFGGPVLAMLGLLTIAFGQDDGAPERRDPTLTPDTIEQRVARLERNLAALDTLVHVRTDTAGVQDRTNRDFNTEMQIRDIEQRLQQLQFRMTNLEQQVSAATRAANQAQSEAQLAQQLARSAAAGIR